jgi:phosphoglycolate phosphatase
MKTDAKSDGAQGKGGSLESACTGFGPTVMYNPERLVVLDADGTTINAFDAIARTFEACNMDIGDLERFQSRHKIFKYLGGLKEFPANVKQHIGKSKRRKLIRVLTEVYREEADLYPGIGELMKALISAADVRVGVVTRNITIEPLVTLGKLFARHDIDTEALDFMVHIPLKDSKDRHFRDVRDGFGINPALSYACGDEKKDYLAALACGMHPFVVSYGFESIKRLIEKAGVPREVISPTPEHLRDRVLHALCLDFTRD